MKKLFLSLLMATVTFTAFAEGEENAVESNWTKKANASLQFTQGYVSKNWYKGGESNFALLATADYMFNYKKNKWAWDNAIEAKLGFITTPSDQYHDFMTNNDLFKWTSKLGLQASKNWYYTLQSIAQTQFCTGFKSNDPLIHSKFFNPAFLNVSLGMDYKKETEKISFALFLGPIAYNLKFVGDPLRNFKTVDGVETPTKGEIDGTQFGLKPGDFNLYDFGATAKATLSYKICKYLTWNSQATYFSPLYNWGKYSNNGYTTIEWENTFDMPLNKYFSTKVFTHLRFDDSVGPENKGAGWGYFQFTELLSFGLSYNW
ncbi:MAG: DUF3078 domain-containing protein [Bacteroidales bacterium]|nr:DUF3078 domain-containing protein [Bacteroidales bacterium]